VREREREREKGRKRERKKVEESANVATINLLSSVRSDGMRNFVENTLIL